MNGNSSTKKLASLPVISLEALINKDNAEVQNLVQAGKKVGMFYLNLQGPSTKAVFDDIPVIFKTGNEFFHLPPDSPEKAESLRTGVERG